MRQGTNYVSPDEACAFLRERNVNGRRIRTLTVIRNDEWADFVEDVGPALSIPDLDVVGGIYDGKYYIDETVGSMRTIAEQDHKRDWASETIKVPDLIDGYARKVEAGLA